MCRYSLRFCHLLGFLSTPLPLPGWLYSVFRPQNQGSLSGQQNTLGWGIWNFNIKEALHKSSLVRVMTSLNNYMVNGRKFFLMSLPTLCSCYKGRWLYEWIQVAIMQRFRPTSSNRYYTRVDSDACTCVFVYIVMSYILHISG